MLRGKQKGICAMMLVLLLCLCPASAARVQAEAESRPYTVQYTVNGILWPDWSIQLQADNARQALANAPNHLKDLGAGYEQVWQNQPQGPVLTVAYRTKSCRASTLQVDASYYASGRLVGHTVQEYAAPAGNRAVIEYLEGTYQGKEYTPVYLSLEHTAFADSDTSLQTPIDLTQTICCSEGVYYILHVRFEKRREPAQAAVACEAQALQSMAATAGTAPKTDALVCISAESGLLSA